MLTAPKATGRPRILDARDRRRLVLELPRILAHFNQSTPHAVCVRTVRRALHNADVMSARRRSKPLASVNNRSMTLAWAKLHRKWTDEWRNVFFLPTRAVSW